MKKNCLTLTLLVIAFSFHAAYGQKKKNDLAGKSWSPEEKHISIDSFPTNMMINHLEGWGSMTVAVNSLPAGTDFAPMLIGLKNNSCQVPHWGYIVKGVLQLIYDDGKEVFLRAGDIFYMPPGHKARVEEDLQLVDFSPESEFRKLFAHIEKKAAEQQKEK